MTRHVYTLGKCDYNGSGRRNCKATFEYEITTRNGYPEFTMSANVWNPRETDIYAGGQCIDDVLEFFPNDKTARRMAEVWRRWHLNGMKAGSPDQEAFLKANPITDRLNHYTAACAALKEAGLNPDPNYIHNGKPYAYGSAWLREELPQDIIDEVNAWPR